MVRPRHPSAPTLFSTGILHPPNTRSRMTDQRPIVSIVCPAYHEQDVLPLFHQELSRILAPLESQYQFEILYIDDGSRDGTLKAMKSVAQSDRRVRVLSLARNFGKEA